jgi:hypothetical protein
MRLIWIGFYSTISMISNEDRSYNINKFKHMYMIHTIDTAQIQGTYRTHVGDMCDVYARYKGGMYGTYRTHTIQ